MKSWIICVLYDALGFMYIFQMVCNSLCCLLGWHVRWRLGAINCVWVIRKIIVHLALSYQHYLHLYVTVAYRPLWSNQGIWSQPVMLTTRANWSAPNTWSRCRPMQLQGGAFTPLFWLGGKGMQMGGLHWSWSCSREAEGTFASRKKQRSFGCQRRRRKILGKGTKSRCHRWRLARGLTQTLLRSMVDLFHATLANLIC